MLTTRMRIVLVVLVCAIALGAGVQWAQAAAGSGWCTDACVDGCEGSGGCELGEASGCSCFYFCMNGDEGEAYCGS